MKRNKLFLRGIIFFITLLTPTLSMSFAYTEVNKNMALKTGYSYLFSFDEKVSRYRLGNTNSAEVEILSNIFNDKHEIVVKPLKSSNTNLLIWTNSGLYNFNISIDQNIAEASPVIQHFTKKDTPISEEIRANLGELDFDLPPQLPDNSVFSFEIDKPPGI